MNESTTLVATAAVDSGSMILRMICRSERPSMRAASMSERGTASKLALNTKMHTIVESMVGRDGSRSSPRLRLQGAAQRLPVRAGHPRVGPRVHCHLRRDLRARGRTPPQRAGATRAPATGLRRGIAQARDLLPRSQALVARRPRYRAVVRDAVARV